MDLHKFINETMKVHENELVNEPEIAQAPEITEELIAGLENEVPGMAEVDQEELKKGLADEAGEHFDSVGGDMVTIAKITMDHLNKYPGQKYYTAMEQLESELSKAEEQEVAPAPVAEPVSEEPEVQTEEPVEEPIAMESKTAEAKVSEETVEMGKAAVAKETAQSSKEAEQGRAANKPETQNGILGEQPAKKYP